MDDGWYQLKPVGPPAAHIESHFAAVGVRLGDTVDNGCTLKLGKYHQELDEHLPIRRGRVKGFLRGHKFYPVLLELLQNIHEV